MYISIGISWKSVAWVKHILLIFKGVSSTYLRTILQEFQIDARKKCFSTQPITSSIPIQCSTNHHYIQNQNFLCKKWHVWFNIHVLIIHLPSQSPTKQRWYTFTVHSPWQHWFLSRWNRGLTTKCPVNFAQD